MPITWKPTVNRKFQFYDTGKVFRYWYGLKRVLLH